MLHAVGAGLRAQGTGQVVLEPRQHLATMSAVELSLTDIVDKVHVDDRGQCRQGRFGAPRAHVEQGAGTLLPYR